MQKNDILPGLGHDPTFFLKRECPKEKYWLKQRSYPQQNWVRNSKHLDVID
jgi:hypothetical protein